MASVLSLNLKIQKEWEHLTSGLPVYQIRHMEIQNKTKQKLKS